MTLTFVLESPDLMAGWLVHFDHFHPGRVGEPTLVKVDERGHHYEVAIP